MPLIDYKCKACDEVTELLIKPTEDIPEEIECKCGEKAVKQLNSDYKLLFTSACSSNTRPKKLV